MKNKGAIYVAIFIAFIMVTSIVGFFYGGSEEERFSYNGFLFERVGEKWVTTVDGKRIDFDYLPNDVNYVNLSEEAKMTIINSKMIYITYSQNQSNLEEIALAQFSLSQRLSELNIFLQSALAEENEFGLAVIDCQNATAFVPVIKFKWSYKDEIIINDNCIVLDGNPSKLKDRLLYGIYGIIK